MNSQPQHLRRPFPFRRSLALLLVLVLILSACNMPQSQGQSETAIAETVAARMTLPGDEDQGTVITDLPSSSAVQITVSVDTNCRSGPDAVYDRLGVLMAGETAEVVGRRAVADYWVIQNPDAPGTCWLWGMYATLVGDVSLLPEMTPPPTPTSPPPTPTTEEPTVTIPPHADFTLTFLGVCNPTTSPWAIFRVINTGSLTLQSAYTSIIDTTASVTMYGPASSDVPFRNTQNCDDFNVVDSLAPGTSIYMHYYLSHTVSGHNAQATIKLCSQDFQEGSCVTRVVNFVFP